MSRKRVVMFFLVTALLFPTYLLAAGGISAENYGEILIENLAIGESYSMMELYELPYKVRNTSDSDTMMKIVPAQPTEGEVKAGFEPIPDAAWVDMGNSLVAVSANETYSTDIKLTIPNDKKYLGKKYQVMLSASLYNPEASLVSVSMGVMGRYLFTIAEVEKPLRSENFNLNMNYGFVPNKVEIKNVELGKKIKIVTDENKPVYIANYGSKKVEGELYSLDPSKTKHKLQEGYLACPSPDFLTFKKRLVSVKGKKKQAIEMWVEFPDKEKYKERKYQFTVSLESGKAMHGSLYMRVLVTTEK